MTDRVQMIRDKLTAALQPTHLEIVDQSAAHAGHEGAKSGGGHYTVTIVAEAFAGQPLLKRHRMVYAALGDAFRSEIHALSIRAHTPDEARAN
ncbi:MAG TPA: BolA family protein [Gammaproteobacteria bacterium]